MRRLILALAFSVGGCTVPNGNYSPPRVAAGAPVATDTAIGDTDSDAGNVSGVDGGTGADMARPSSPDLAQASPPSPDLAPACPAHANSCTPGDEQNTADGCEEKTCDSACWWSGWTLKPGAACVTGTRQGCDAGLSCPTAGVQTCIGCQWSACSCN
jgi:hypothetical protein